MHQSFLTHENFRYFWLASALVLISIFLYLFHEPAQVPNGGTWLGYTLGTLGALLILWLLYLGRRKRNFSSNFGSVRGWVSAHVYFGSALIIIATLHTGFQFGYNVHTLAYVMMCLVILSGFYGVWAYRTFPEARNDMKRSQTLDEIFLQLEEADLQVKKEIARLPEDIQGVVMSAIDRTEIGGGIWAQITGADASKVIIGDQVTVNRDQTATINWLVNRLAAAQGDEAKKMSALIRDYGARQKLLRVIREDIRMSGLQEMWLYFHVPMSFGLLGALTAHIVSVFVYW